MPRRGRERERPCRQARVLHAAFVGCLGCLRSFNLCVLLLACTICQLSKARSEAQKLSSGEYIGAALLLSGMAGNEPQLLLSRRSWKASRNWSAVALLQSPRPGEQLNPPLSHSRITASPLPSSAEPSRMLWFSASMQVGSN